MKEQLSMMDILEMAPHKQRKVEKDIVIARKKAPARHERLLKDNSILLKAICSYLEVDEMELVNDGRATNIVEARTIFSFCASYFIQYNIDLYIAYTIDVTRTMPIHYRKNFKLFKQVDLPFKIKSDKVIEHLTKIGFKSKKTESEILKK